MLQCSLTRESSAYGKQSESARCPMQRGERALFIGCSQCPRLQCTSCVQAMANEAHRYGRDHVELVVDKNITAALSSCLDGSAVAAAQSPSSQKAQQLVAANVASFDAQGIMRFGRCPLCARDAQAVQQPAPAPAPAPSNPQPQQQQQQDEDSTEEEDGVEDAPAEQEGEEEARAALRTVVDEEEEGVEVVIQKHEDARGATFLLRVLASPMDAQGQDVRCRGSNLF